MRAPAPAIPLNRTPAFRYGNDRMFLLPALPFLGFPHSLLFCRVSADVACSAVRSHV
jgi:hypothetical protein